MKEKITTVKELSNDIKSVQEHIKNCLLIGHFKLIEALKHDYTIDCEGFKFRLKLMKHSETLFVYRLIEYDLLIDITEVDLAMVICHIIKQN